MKPSPTIILVDAREIRVGDTINSHTHLRPRIATVERVLGCQWSDMVGTLVPAVEFLARECETGALVTVVRIHGAQIWRVVP